MSTWTDLDLTDDVEQVAATVWARQLLVTEWADLTPVEQHNCREAVLPFVVATRDALTPHVSTMLDQSRAERDEALAKVVAVERGVEMMCGEMSAAAYLTLTQALRGSHE